MDTASWHNNRDSVSVRSLALTSLADYTVQDDAASRPISVISGGLDHSSFVEPSVTTPELRRTHVEPAPNISGGLKSEWAEIAENIRAQDVKKIKEYRDEMDSLLVFAGLFSAVLSALLAESFQSLEPDQSAATVVLLTQMVAQTRSYTITAGFVNTTVAPLDATSVFGPGPSAALRGLNALWFASLALSLISASFAILVKQWLREYLREPYPAPQARVRAQLFRAPGLYDWKVFELGGILLLLLQLSLGLFFAGLCIFTLNVDKVVGYTVIPLVGGWIALFAAVSFSPVISPRCPYKIPIMNSTTRQVRKALSHIVLVFGGWPNFKISTITSEKSMQFSGWRNWLWLGYDEEDAVNDTRRDVDILIAIERTRQDDQLLLKMCTALKEMHSTPAVIIDFVLNAVTSRLPDLELDSNARPISPMLDLSQLPAQTCTILMDTVAGVLTGEVREFLESGLLEWTGPMRDCVSLLAARMPCLLPEKATTAVSLCFSKSMSLRSGEGAVALWFSNVGNKEDGTQGTYMSDRYALCLHLLVRLRNLMLRLDAREFYTTICLIMRKGCCTCGGLCNFVVTILDRHGDTIPLVLNQEVCHLMSAYLLRQVNAKVEWNLSHRALWDTLFRYWTPQKLTPWHDQMSELVRHLLTGTSPMLPLYFHEHLFRENGEDSEKAWTVFELMFRDFDLLTEKHQILTNMHDAFTSYLHEETQSPVPPNDQFYVGLLSFVGGHMKSISELIIHNERPHTDRKYRTLYLKMWKTMHNAMRRFGTSSRTDEQTRRAQTCLEKIDELDDLWLPASQIQANADEEFDKWVIMFDAAESFFDDDTIVDLMKFLPSAKEAPYKRVRRIHKKRELAHTPEAVEKRVRDQAVQQKGSNSTKATTDSNRTRKTTQNTAAADDEAEHEDGAQYIIVESPEVRISPEPDGDIDTAPSANMDVGPIFAFTFPTRNEVVSELGGHTDNTPQRGPPLRGVRGREMLSGDDSRTVVADSGSVG